MYRSGQFFTYYAAEVLRQVGDRADSVREGVEVEVCREPMGVIGYGAVAERTASARISPGRTWVSPRSSS